MGYQSFPWEQGTSQSLAKLKCLFLPVLTHKSVLDVGCAHGYFAGFAAFQKASYVKGIDTNRGAIQHALKYFPQCDFACCDWRDLNARTYDIILCLSVLQYVPESQQFIDFLMQHLASDGLLVLEVGLAHPSSPSAPKSLDSADDQRIYPTYETVQKLLAPYCFKTLGFSVPDPEDDHPRLIYHVCHKKPYCVLFLDEPYSGKTSTLQALLKNDLKILTGDAIFSQVAHGTLEVSAQLSSLITFVKNTQHLNCYQIIHSICASHQALSEYLSLLASLADKKDFVLDQYIPASYHTEVQNFFNAQGYYVVNISTKNAQLRNALVERPQGTIYEAYEKYLARTHTIDEAAYLAANPDVAAIIANGTIPNATYHYFHFGIFENRKLS